MSPQARRKIIKNIEAKALPLTVFTMLVVAGLSAVFVMQPNQSVVRAASISDFDGGHITYTINNSQVSGSLSGFTVLFSKTVTELDGLTDDDFSFFNSSDVEMDWELELWDDATDKLVAWINFPSLSGGETFSLYYESGSGGNSGGENNVSSVYDSDHIGVWHMNSSTATVYDTLDSNDGTKKGATEPTQGTGKIGYAQVFDGTDDYVDMGYDTSLRASTMTIEAWVKTDDYTLADSQEIVTKDDEWYFWIEHGAGDVFSYEPHAGEDALATSSPVDDTWYYVVGVYDGSNSKLYVNGVLEESAAGNSPPQDGHDFVVGAHGNGANGGTPNSAFWDGSIDEVVYSDVERDINWIKTKYNMVNNQSTFITSDVDTVSLTLHGGVPSNYTFTLQGMATDTVYSNNSGSYCEYGEFNFTIDGSDYYERFTLNISDITNGVIDASDVFLSFDDDNSSWSGNWHQCSDGGESIIFNNTTWDSNNYMSGSNPFTTDGDSDGYKEMQSTCSIWMLVRIDIPSDATNTTHAKYDMTWDAGNYN